MNGEISDDDGARAMSFESSVIVLLLPVVMPGSISHARQFEFSLLVFYFVIGIENQTFYLRFIYMK